MGIVDLNELEKKYQLIIDTYNDEFLNDNLIIHEKMRNLLTTCFFLLDEETKAIRARKSNKRMDFSLIRIQSLIIEISLELDKLTHSRKNENDLERNIQLIKKINNEISKINGFSPWCNLDNYRFISCYVRNKKHVSLFTDIIDKWEDNLSETICRITALDSSFFIREEFSVPVHFSDLDDLYDIVKEYVSGLHNAINLSEYICKNNKELIFGQNDGLLKSKDENGLLYAVETLNEIMDNELAYIIAYAKELEKTKYDVSNLFCCSFDVPLNEDGIQELEECRLGQNVKKFHFLPEEYYVLRKQGAIFDKFDNELNINIGIGEHKLYKKDISKVLRVLVLYKRNIGNEIEMQIIERLEEALNLAKELDTFVEISVLKNRCL